MAISPFETLRKQVGARRKHLAQLDEHGPKFLARAAKMLGARPIAVLVLEELIVDNSDAVTREDGQDFAVALAFCYLGASNHITSNIKTCLARNSLCR
jgi:hypothetical protein